MAAATDSKSVGGNPVGVRLPPPVPPTSSVVTMPTPGPGAGWHPAGEGAGTPASASRGPGPGPGAPGRRPLAARGGPRPQDARHDHPASARGASGLSRVVSSASPPRSRAAHPQRLAHTSIAATPAPPPKPPPARGTPKWIYGDDSERVFEKPPAPGAAGSADAPTGRTPKKFRIEDVGRHPFDYTDRGPRVWQNLRRQGPASPRQGEQRLAGGEPWQMIVVRCALGNHQAPSNYCRDATLCRREWPMVRQRPNLRRQERCDDAEQEPTQISDAVKYAVPHLNVMRNAGEEASPIWRRWLPEHVNYIIPG